MKKISTKLAARSSNSNENGKPPITTRLSEKKMANSHPVWGVNTEDKYYRVMRGTTIPNSSIRAKILQSEKIAQDNEQKKKNSINIYDSSSEEEDLRRSPRMKSLDELKVLNNLLKKTHVPKKPQVPSVKKTRFEIIVESIKKSKMKSLEERLGIPDIIHEEVEPTSHSSTITIEEKRDAEAEQKKPKKNIKKKKQKIKPKKIVGQRTSSSSRDTILVDDQKQNVSKKDINKKTSIQRKDIEKKQSTTSSSKTAKKKIVRKKKSSKEKIRTTSQENLEQGSKGILSRQDFLSNDVVSYLEKRSSMYSK